MMLNNVHQLWIFFFRMHYDYPKTLSKNNTADFWEVKFIWPWKRNPSIPLMFCSLDNGNVPRHNDKSIQIFFKLNKYQTRCFHACFHISRQLEWKMIFFSRKHLNFWRSHYEIYWPCLCKFPYSVTTSDKGTYLMMARYSILLLYIIY